MEEAISIGPDNLINLLPIIQGFIEDKKKGQKIDVEQTVRDAAGALGIDDIEGFVQDRMQDALSEVLSEEDSKKLAEIMVTLGASAAKLIGNYCQGGIYPAALKDGLDDLLVANNSAIVDVAKSSYGLELTPEVDAVLAQYSLAGIAICCFTITYKIYAKAADDARIAHEHRIVIERRCEESVAECDRYHHEMERLVDKYLGKHLDAFEAGAEAMDSSLLADDADGYIAANANLQRLLGREQQFHNQEEFEDLMASDDVFKL
ncbi:MAG: hypothetical protein WAY93_10025 [Atopobiaceae bacterium]|jgi:hypothetical protein|nr:hypothetical protein [Atopobiaceae bacterium]